MLSNSTPFVQLSAYVFLLYSAIRMDKRRGGRLLTIGGHLLCNSLVYSKEIDNYPNYVAEEIKSHRGSSN